MIGLLPLKELPTLTDNIEELYAGSPYSSKRNAKSMESRHEQPDQTDAQRAGLSEIIREGKSESLNRAKEALKRRLLQTLMQQVLDEVQDADEVADEALQLLDEEDEILSKAKEALKTRLLQQLMEEAIAEIDEEVGSEDELDESAAGADYASDFGEGEPAEDSDEEYDDADDVVDEAAGDEERAEASAESEWSWNASDADEAETDESDIEEDPEEAPFEVAPFDAQAEDDEYAEDPAEASDDEVDTAEPVFSEEQSSEESPFFDEPEVDEEVPSFAGDDVDEEQSYLQDALRDWADSDDEAEDHDFLMQSASDPPDVAKSAEGDTVPFEDFEEYDSALSFEDEVPSAQDADEPDDNIWGTLGESIDAADPASAFALDEFELSDLASDEEVEYDEADAFHPATQGEADVEALEEAFHEPISTEFEDGLGYYVYGIIPADHNVPDEAFPEGGIADEHPVFIVEEGPIRALVSRVPEETFNPDTLQDQMEEDAWAETQVRRHQQILEQLMQYAPMIPMRFGSVYANESHLRDMLQERMETFSDTLGRLEGNQEWTLTIRCDVEQLRRYVMEDSEKVQDLLQDMRSKPRGVAQFIKKQMVVAIHDEVQYLQDDCTERSHEALSTFAEDSHSHVQAGEDADSDEIVKTAYLVRKADEGDFMGEIERLRGIYGRQGFSYEISGPWPPYSFSQPRPAQSASLENEGFDV